MLLASVSQCVCVCVRTTLVCIHRQMEFEYKASITLAQHIFHILQNSNTCDTYSLYILSNCMPVRHTFACRVLWLPSLYCFQCKIYNVYRLYAPHSHSLSRIRIAKWLIRKYVLVRFHRKSSLGRSLHTHKLQLCVSLSCYFVDSLPTINVQETCLKL